MKRNRLLVSIASAAIIAATPAIAEPGNGRGGGQDAGAMGGMGETMRDVGRAHSEGAEYANPRAIERANDNSVLKSGTDTTVTTTESVRGNGRVNDEVSTGSRTGSLVTTNRSRNEARAEARAEANATARMQTDLSGVTSGMSVVDSSGATVGTVTGVSTKGNDSIRSVQVTLTDGTIVTLSPKSLSVDGDVLTTTSTTTNVKSQGAAHANINGLIHASPNSALAGAGVTTLTGLNTGLTVENSTGASIGTVSQIFTNRTGAVVGIQVDLAAGGTVTIPATTLMMDGTTVVTSSANL